ncbi:MAG: hypothetical protein KKA52_03040 [Candidatus Omnitrophica bacterium]|nr:hypothetical protein [Candidatus Omnitrophota bacterium]
MQTSVFIAKILGPVCVIIGVSLMVNRKFYQKVMEDFSKNAALLFLAGIMPLFIGFLVVLSHNVWELSWRLIITIYGWGGIIKGVWMIVLPDSVAKFMQMYQKNEALLKMHSVIVVIVGAVLSFFGYIAG